MDPSTVGIDEARRIERALEDVSEGADEPAEVDLHPDRTKQFTAVGFARMKTAWNPEEQEIVDIAKDVVEQELLKRFSDVYQVLFRLYTIVRTPVVDAHGEVRKDEYGFPIWQLDETGSPIEDWNLLGEKDKEQFLHTITTRMFTWEQRSDDMWGDAMFAKAIWEERFSDAFTGTPKVDGRRPTEADRTQHAQGKARDDRYFAIFMSLRSKKAQSLVRSMERIAMRLNATLS